MSSSKKEMSSSKKENFQADCFDGFFVSEQPELRKIASFLKRIDGSVTLNVTALVARARCEAAWRSPGRLSLSCIFGEFVCCDENTEQLARNDRELLALDAALSELASLELRQAQMLEWHFFGGLTWIEVAECLGISIATAERDSKLLRA